MVTVYSVASMVLYLVFFSCLATIVMATWIIFDTVIQYSLYSKENVKIIETRPREICFVLWDHCQNYLDDPRTKCIWSRCFMSYFVFVRCLFIRKR